MPGWPYRKLGSRFFVLWIAFEAFTAITITLATVALFSLYEDMSTALFWELVIVALIYTGVRTKHLAEPVVRWVKDGRDPAGAAEAWRRAVSLPREVVVRNGPVPFAIVALPIAVAYAVRLDLPWWRWRTRPFCSSSPRSCSCGRWWRTSSSSSRPTGPDSPSASRCAGSFWARCP